MKKFKKLIPVALGLLTLASCSDDSFISEKAQQGDIKLEKGEMLVTMEAPQEDGTAFTRGYTSRDMQTRRWWSGVDKLMVFGSQFGAYDAYQFLQGVDETSGKFKIVSSPSYVSEAKWALFPFDQISNGKWELVGGLYNSASTVDVDLPQTIVYDAAYDAANYETDKQPYYLDNLPRWGEVTSTNEGAYLSTSLNWLTGILRLQLAGTPEYANGVRIRLLEAGDPAKTLAINGTFNVKIAQNDIMIPTACITADGYAYDEDEDGAIYVYIPEIEKLTAEDKAKSVIYLPLPIWDKQVDIEISFPDPASPTAYKGQENGGTDLTPAVAWKKYTTLKNKTILRGKVYGNKDEYNLALDGTNPEAISDALELIETDAETITLKAKNPIDVCEATNNTVIEIPNKEGVKDIILDLSAGLDGCATDQTLKIVYKNSGDKFQGNVTLITPSTAGTNPIKLDVDLDESGFAIVEGAVIQQAAYGDMDIDAKEFVVGSEDPFHTTAIAVDGLKLSSNVEALTVATQGKLNGAFVIDQTAASQDDWVYPAVKTITVNGQLNGKIDADTKVKDTFITNIKVEGDDAVVGSHIITKGTVEINSKQTFPGGAGIVADGAITITGEATITGPINSRKSTVALSGKVTANSTVDAKGDISIIEEANAIAGNITSEEGDITISNTKAFTYTGNVEAKKGNVSLTSTKAVEFSGTVHAKKDLTVSGKVSLTNTTAAQGEQDVFLSGEAKTKDITAGRDYSITEKAQTDGGVSLKRAATVNITTADGDAVAVTGTIAYADGSDYALNLLNGYVYTVDATAGEVKLTFATTGAFAAIASVTTPDNLKPQNKSIWNGKLINSTDEGIYGIDDTRIWTASQLANQMKTVSTSIELRSNIDLNNETWNGIEAAGYNITGNYLTISNVKAKGNKTDKTAGFINKATGAVTINNLTFDGVQTDIVSISGGQYDGGIGAVIGNAQAAAGFSRVIVKLAGDNFGTKTDKNVKTANVGGLIGLAQGAVELTGVQIDASATTLTAYKNIGGFIGKATKNVDIKMAEEDGSDPEIFPTVTGLKMYVTFDATEGSSEVNDPYQGTTGQFIGAINLGKNITIIDVDNVKPTLTIAGKANEAVAFKIEDTTHRYFFGRGDQTLIGQSGFELPTILGTFKINDKTYEVFKTGKPFTVGSPKLYELTNEPHVN